MVSVDKAVIAHIKKGSVVFEILVDPEKALEFKKGKEYAMENILAVNHVYTDSRKGEKAGDKDLEKAFGTTDVFKIAAEIIRHGDVQLTTEQRRKMTEEKYRQIADIISKQGINPQSNLPHPAARIMNAMEQAHVNVDPFKPAQDQVNEVLNKIQPIIPIRFERVEVAVRVPIEHAGRASAIIRNMAPIKKEEWQAAYWFALIEIPAGMQGDIYSRLNELTGGHVEVKVVKKV
ncbi:MAG: ribosome assembly factor SBDS [Candidatus Aenigmarchaeota archaeon]|nr:ribosome assembly factor SBDS [Candidatus Aenigmarchaeota archaeon]